MQPLVFIANSAAPGYREDLASRVRLRFPDAPVLLTGGPGETAGLAEAGLERLGGRDGAVVACGGDGTFRDVASTVGMRARVGFVPLGTVNLVARELGIPGDLGGALECLADDHAVEVFGGRCIADRHGPGQLFFIAVSAGPDAEAVHWVRPRSKKLLGRYAYLSGFLAGLLGPVRSGIAFRHRLGVGDCGQLLVLRAPHYAGTYRISDVVSLERPGLEVVTVPCGRRRVLRFFWNVYRSRLRCGPGVERTLVEEVSIRLPPGGRFQVDGDPFRAEELRITSESTPIRVLVPRPGRHLPRAGRRGRGSSRVRSVES